MSEVPHVAQIVRVNRAARGVRALDSQRAVWQNHEFFRSRIQGISMARIVSMSVEILAMDLFFFSSIV